VVIPNAFSDQSSESGDLSRQRDQLIAVGSFDWLKGHDFALRAYARSGAKNKIPLKVFGQRFSPYTEQLRSLAGELGLDADLVTFHQDTDKETLLEEYRKSRVLISGSRTECQPLVLLDAMAAGTPFVARACGCIPYLPGGVAVRTDSEAGASLDSLLADPTAWRAMSEEGISAANAKFHPGVVGDALHEFISRPPV